jgi:hypothetical protein
MIKLSRARARVQTATVKKRSRSSPYSGSRVIPLVLAAFCSLSAGAVTVVTDCSENALLSALARDSVVTFATNCSITLSAPILVGAGVTKQIDAGGHTVTLSGNNAVSLFTVHGNLTLVGLALVNGHNTNGGALYINPSGTVTATNCTFTGNMANGLNGPAGPNGANNDSGVGGNGGDGGNGTSGLGGAIYNAGILNLLQCTLATNSATGGNGGNGGRGGDGGGTLSQGGDGGIGGNGAPGYGGAVYNVSNLVVMNCTVAGNAATGGAGGAGGTNGAGTFVSLAGRGGAGANGSGGGIYNAKNMNARSSTFSSNSVRGGSSAAGGNQANGVGSIGAAGGDGTGGAVWSTWWGLMTNCTVYSDKATGGNGGNGGDGSGTLPKGGDGGNGGSGWGAGVFNAGTLTVVNCTISSSRAVAGTNGVSGQGTFSGSPGQMGQTLGGGIASSGGTFNLINSILATNASGGNGFGTISDLGYSLSSDASIPLTGAGSAVNSNPRLGPLAMNGGPTATMMLLAGSPAINRIPPAAAPNVDQRGYPRPLPAGGLSDIGAYEYELASPPVIIQPPTNAIVLQGRSTTFFISAVGAPTLLYQWHLNGTNIPGATRSTYSVTNATTTNAGAANPYDVLVSNGLGATNSGAVYAFLAPAIVVAPTNQRALVGSDVSFSIQAVGDPTLSYQWQLNGAPISGATNSTYTRTDAQVADAGVYKAMVSNGSGVTNASARLDFLPTILVLPTNHVAQPGDSVTFFVQADGSPTLQYQWQFNGTNLAGATSTNLTLANVQGTNTGSYTVTITNSFGTTNASARLDLAPYIVNQPTNQTVVAGSSAAFFVTAAGSPVLAYQWRLNGAGLAGATNASYAIGSAQSADLGAYTVFISNPFGSVTSAPATLGFGVPPSILGQPTNVTLLVGSNATFAVRAAGSPTVTYQWRYNGANIAGATASQFTINNLRLTNSGNYDAIVANPFGQTNTSVARLAVVLPFTISGRVLDVGATNGLSGVNITAGTNSTLTDLDGFYTLSGLASNSYTVIPLLECYLFSPSNNVVTVGGGTNAAGVDFNATHDSYLIGGRVAIGPSGLGNVTVTLAPGGRTSVTDTNGQYAFPNLCAGAYTVSATSSSCYLINPTSQTNVIVGPANAPNVDFSATANLYGVSGFITNGAARLAGVSVQIVGLTNSASTDTNGYYSLTNLCPGTYTVVPSLNCSRFNPASRVIQVPPSQSQVNFSGSTNDVFAVSGQVTTNGTNGLAGVSVTDGTQTVVTDANGYYLLTHVCPGVVSVAPSFPGYAFTPPVSNLTVTANTSGVNFIAYPAFNIGGAVYELVGGQSNRLRGITLNLSHEDHNLGNTMTEDDGSYEFRALPPSTNAYIITPLDHCWLFSPTNFPVLVGPDRTNIDFMATSDKVHTIAGNVAEGGVGLSNVVVQATFGPLTFTNITDINGNYSFSNLCSGSYTITPSQACVAFSPPSQTVTPSPGVPDPTSVNFASYPNTFAVSGQVTNVQGGAGLSGVNVSGGGLTAITDAYGNYLLAPICPGPLTVVPSLDGFGFTPPTSSLTITGALSGVNFGAFPAAGLSVSLGTNGLPQLSFVAAPGTTYYLDASANLLSWQTIFSTNAPVPVTIQFTDAATTNYSVRFYRLHH